MDEYLRQYLVFQGHGAEQIQVTISSESAEKKEQALVAFLKLPLAQWQQLGLEQKKKILDTKVCPPLPFPHSSFF